MNRILVELTAPDFPEVTFHTQVRFGLNISEGSYYNLDFLVDGSDIDDHISPVGKTVIEQVKAIAGVGDVMVGCYGFSIRMGKAFDHSEMLMDILGIMEKEFALFGGGLDISVRLGRGTQQQHIGPYAKDTTRPALAELTASTS